MSETVYISSTYEDLREFRQGIIDCLIGLGEYYRPSSMEFYDAENRHFVDKCLTDVENCDVYILILGKRYGYKPNGFDKTITELEYQKAIASNKEILVFKVGMLADSYTYKEGDSQFQEYNQEFTDTVSEYLTPKPFDSVAELKFQVSQSLSKRLFKKPDLIPDLIRPDSDALCFCDRNQQATGLSLGILQKKKIFFITGNKQQDIPSDVVKRFTKFKLGSKNKINPLIKVSDMFLNLDDSDFSCSFHIILEYLNIDPDGGSIHTKGFLKTLSMKKRKRIILPFYYDLDFEGRQGKFVRFIQFLDELFSIYHQSETQSFELYVLASIYTNDPSIIKIQDIVNETLDQEELKFKSNLKGLISYLKELGPVDNNDITDWLEKFWTTANYSIPLFNRYFEQDVDQRSMQDISSALLKLMKDIENADPEILQYLK